MKHSRIPAVLLIALACTHSDAFENPAQIAYGPRTTGTDVQLTYNVDQNYWPTWTQDGKGILYAFVDREHVNHRCLGLIPAAGGSRSWQLCDNRAVRDDSINSYGAFALDSTGRLLLVEAMSHTGISSDFPARVRLQLTDTNRPSFRTTLLTLPVTVGNTPVTWLSEVRWTGQNSFTALGQQFSSVPQCLACACFPCPRDTLFTDGGGIVLLGTINGSTVTLQAVAGTDSATGYSLAENGASIVFTRRHDLHLYKVPVVGGTPVQVIHVGRAADPGELIAGELTGVTCRNSTCLVARSAIFITGTYNDMSLFAHYLSESHPMDLHRITLGAASDVVVRTTTDLRPFSTPQISPANGDVTLQIGGVWGHLQNFTDPRTANGEIHLVKGIFP